jgi:hypothetical protein
MITLALAATLLAARPQPPHIDVPPGAIVVSDHTTHRHRHGKTRRTRTVVYRPALTYQTTPADLVGSIVCTPTARVLIGQVPADVLTQADSMVRDDTVVTVDGLTVGYTGTCTTTNVFIPPLSNISVGYEFPASWVSEEIKPVGATFVPWDVDRMTLPALPYYGDPVRVRATH